VKELIAKLDALGITASTNDGDEDEGEWEDDSEEDSDVEMG
jgi:hypothetical protein